MNIYNHTDKDFSTLEKVLRSFMPYAENRLEYTVPCDIHFESDPENAKEMFGKTAYYDPDNFRIVVFVDNRHPKDILRSISHEVVHHSQNCRGEFDNISELGEGYAQDDPHLRKMEAEAYLVGNGFLVRDFEDSLKKGEDILQEWAIKNNYKIPKRVLKEEKVTVSAKKEETINLRTLTNRNRQNLFKKLRKKYTRSKR